MGIIENLLNTKIADNIIFTPENVATDMVNMVPNDLWNSETKFFDPCCKSGIYLKIIYNKLMEKLSGEIKNELDRRNHILNNQLYAIGQTEFCTVVSQRNLYGEIKNDCNIKYLGEYMDNIKNTEKEYRTKLERAFGENMKFDVIIGNPPYQNNTQSIYQYFIDKSLNLTTRCSIMIVKNNWMSSDTLKDTRDNLIKNGLKEIINYPIPGEVFKDAATVSVNIFNVDKQLGVGQELSYKSIENGKITSEYKDDISKYSIIPKNKIERDIIYKVTSLMDRGSFSGEVYPTEPFRVTSTFTVGRGVNTYGLDISDEQNDYYNIKIAYMDGQQLAYKYCNINDIPARNELVDKYKIISGSRLNNNQNVLTNIRAIDKNSICTGQWAVLYCGDNIEITKNVFNYINTRFFRFMTGLLVDGNMTGISPYRFRLVPTQDFTKSWTDEELYKKYNLTQEEIDYIENKIKAMD